MDPAWVGVIGSLGGVVLTSGVGIAGAAVNHRWQSSVRSEERQDRLHESRAALRREAYTRILITSDRLVNFLPTRTSPVEPEQLRDEKMAIDRLRQLWLGADELIAEYNAALAQGRLLAGNEVAAALEEYDDWMMEQFSLLGLHPDPDESKAFEGIYEKRGPLLQAMRREQDGDLLPGGEQ